MAELGINRPNNLWINKHQYSSTYSSPQSEVTDVEVDMDEDKYEYEILDEEAIGRGSYGIVRRALNKKTNKIVAMKEELKGLSPSTIAEIEALETLGSHPCIVGFERVVLPEGSDSVFVVMECMMSDLKKWREKRRKPYSLIEIKYIIEEILKGVAFLHDNGIMHRDLKPANVLIGHKAEIKIGDFGMSARVGGESASKSRSSRVGTKRYKAPELLLGARGYTCAVDVWSVGCIMAELLVDRVFFQGISDDEQLDCIRRTVSPSFSFIRQKMAAAAAALTAAGLDLLERLLTYEANKRITARDALDHAWFGETTNRF